jgi:hypothetical protein
MISELGQSTLLLELLEQVQTKTHTTQYLPHNFNGHRLFIFGEKATAVLAVFCTLLNLFFLV